MNVLGIDFTSAPSRRKPLTISRCHLMNGRLEVRSVERVEDFRSFELLLSSGKWVAGMDFPFGMPRRLLDNLGWPSRWSDYVSKISREYSREGFAALIKSYSAARPYGDKQHFRRTDRLAGAQTPMKMDFVPVGKMFYEGAPRLLKSTCAVMPCRPRSSTRVALEAYPGVAARSLLGGKRTYKIDDPKRQLGEHRAARDAILRALTRGSKFGFDLALPLSIRRTMIDDGTGDKLDSLLCAAQAGWSFVRRSSGWGMPVDCDPAEGWICGPELEAGSS